MTHLTESQSARLLGYPADSRLLIINADDFGMCHAINEAILRSLQEGVVCSTSLMVPCPWALHAMKLLRENPDISFAIHLTLICDQANYKWRPLTCGEKIPSLVDEDGYCYSINRREEFLAQAKLEELEIEFRAQIEKVFNAQLQPTHLDWHCLYNGGRADILDLSLALAKEYGLALRVSQRPLIEELHRQGLPTDEHDLMDSYRIDPVEKFARYTQMLRGLPIGLNEWAVHPGLDNAEMQAVEADSWQVRTTDYQFVISPQTRAIIEEEGIILLGYKQLQEIWRAAQ